jgi:hypothetical protein
MKSPLFLLCALFAVSAQASTLGVATSSAGHAYWETFPSSTTYPTVTLSNAAATFADTTDFSASLSAAMPGSTPGGGERIYSGTGVTGNAFNLTIDVVANSSFDALSLQLKFTGPLQNVALEDNIVPASLHFSVFGDAAWDDPVQTYLGASVETAGTFYIYAWTWTGLDVDASDAFAITLTSDPGHVSVDAIRLDAAVIPEPSAVAALAGLAALGVSVLRRRNLRQYSRT